jgi:hypothetical protein
MEKQLLQAQLWATSALSQWAKAKKATEKVEQQQGRGSPRRGPE